MKRQVWRAPAAEQRRLERQYHSLVRQKKRQYQQAEMGRLLDSRCLQDRRFWTRLCGPPTSLPATLQNVQAWASFTSAVADAQLSQVADLPDIAYPQHPQQPAATFNSDVPVEEVQHHVQLLHKGCSTGTFGLPAEFLRYAKAERQRGQGLPGMFWPPPSQPSSTEMTIFAL